MLAEEERAYKQKMERIDKERDKAEKARRSVAAVPLARHAHMLTWWNRPVCACRTQLRRAKQEAKILKAMRQQLTLRRKKVRSACSTTWCVSSRLR